MIILQLLGAILLIAIYRLYLDDSTIYSFLFTVLPSIALIRKKTIKHLLKLTTAFILGAMFLVLIRGINWNSDNLSINYLVVAKLLSFYFVLFIILSAVATRYDRKDWYEHLSRLVGGKVAILLILPVSAFELYREHAGVTLYAAQARYGKKVSIFKRFKMLLVSVVPLIYSTLVRMEVSLNSSFKCGLCLKRQAPLKSPARYLDYLFIVLALFASSYIVCFNK